RRERGDRGGGEDAKPGEDGRGSVEEEGGPERDGGVDEAERERGAEEPELRQDEQGKEERGGERAHVVERQNPRDEFLQVGALLEDADEERQLEPDADADERDDD
ncbi:MAG: hypothetical protein ACK559_14580, partial [bacterium]